MDKNNKYYEVLYGANTEVKKLNQLQEGLLIKYSLNKCILYNDEGLLVSQFYYKKLINHYRLKIDGYIDKHNNFIKIENEIDEKEFNNTLACFKKEIIKKPVIKEVKVKKNVNNKIIFIDKTYNNKLKFNLILENEFLKKWKDYQIDGVKEIIYSVLGIKNEGYYGLVVGDSMGLGKTIQILIVLYILTNQNPFGKTPYINKVLILCNSSLVQSWEKEINKW